MKKLLIFGALTLGLNAFGQDFYQYVSIRMDSTQENIEGVNKIYELDTHYLTLNVFQKPEGFFEDELSEELFSSLITINDFILPIELTDSIKIEIVDLVSDDSPEIIIYSLWRSGAYDTYIINFFKDRPFVVTKIGLMAKIIEEKGVIKHSPEGSSETSNFEYNYESGNNEFYLFREEFWYCKGIIQKIIFEELIGYSIKETMETLEIYCGACFTGEVLVSVSDSEKKTISSLKVGDQVLTYDFLSRQNKISQIEGIISVPHDVYIEYHFDHDSITSTLDHPFYVSDKGWSSFDPEATSSRYNNYNAVDKIAIGDVLKLSNGKKSSLIGYTIIEERRPSYTITKLSDGDSFYVNDILVGVENFDQHCLNKK